LNESRDTHETNLYIVNIHYWFFIFSVFQTGTVKPTVEENPNFKEFMEDVEEDLQLRKIKGRYDKILSDEELATHAKAKKIVMV
jgi:hypothetical protein